ncbi:MAG: hypothetical protein AAF191_07105 [Verrucomicrobiota bacterium]
MNQTHDHMKSPPVSPSSSVFLPSALTGLLALAITSCGPGPEATESRVLTDEPDPLEQVLLSGAPADAVHVVDARKQPQPGQSLTVTGVIGGGASPFTEGYATFTLADDGLDFCHEIPGDDCPTPWDACCEDPDKIKAGLLLVQVPGPDGRPLTRSLKGIGGLKELDTVTVTGVVAEGSSPDNLILNATGIFRDPESPSA